MIIRIDTAKLYRALYTLRQNSEILSAQIKRLNRLEEKVCEAWYSPESTFDFTSEIQRLREGLDRMRSLTEDEIGLCAKIINKARMIEEGTGGGSGGGGF